MGIFLEFLSDLKFKKRFQEDACLWNPWFSEGKVRKTVGFLT